VQDDPVRRDLHAGAELHAVLGQRLPGSAHRRGLRPAPDALRAWLAATPAAPYQVSTFREQLFKRTLSSVGLLRGNKRDRDFVGSQMKLDTEGGRFGHFSFHS
jgi:hypothetical protein